MPYSCNSWRCEVCRRHEAAVTFARIKQAAEPLPPDGWCFLVLTIDRAGYYGGRGWSDVNEAYASLGKMTRATLSRIGRIWGPETVLERSGRSKELRTVRKLGNRWVAVVEAHRSGWPHVNLLVWCPELAAELRADHQERLDDPEISDALDSARDGWKRGVAVTREIRERAREAVVVRGALLDLATHSGWGRQSTAEAARSADAIAGYVVKLAGMHDASVGELAKITQAPLNAPIRFRRLRSGKGFLPPRRKDETVTGCLVRRRRSAEGDWEIQAINAPSDESQAERVLMARAAELELMAEEESLLSRNRGKLPPRPPLRAARNGRLLTESATGALRQRASALSDSALESAFERASTEALWAKRAG